MARPDPIPPRAQWQINDERNRRAMLRGAGRDPDYAAPCRHTSKPDTLREAHYRGDHDAGVTAVPHPIYVDGCPACAETAADVIDELPAGATAEPWDARDDAEEHGEAWSRARRNANAWRTTAAVSPRTGDPDATIWRASDLGLVPVNGRRPARLDHSYAVAARDNADRWAGVLFERMQATR